MKKREAYLIEPSAETIAQTFATDKEFRLPEVAALLNCRFVQIVPMPGAELWLDEDGGPRGEKAAHAFSIDGGVHFGRALYIPLDGHELDPSRVRFLGPLSEREIQSPVTVISFSGDKANDLFAKAMENASRGRIRP